MKAIILAAGMGTRLNKYTKDIPKCMLPFLDKPIINWHLFQTCLRKGSNFVFRFSNLNHCLESEGKFFPIFLAFNTVIVIEGNDIYKFIARLKFQVLLFRIKLVCTIRIKQMMYFFLISQIPNCKLP